MSRLLTCTILAGLLAGCGATQTDGARRYDTPGDADHQQRAAREAAAVRGAEAAFQDGDLDAADRLYREAAEANPRSVAARLGLASVAERRHLDGEAERWLRDALTLEPERHKVRYRLISALLRQRRVTEARKELQIAVAGDQGDERIELRLKGAIALRSGQVTQAARLFEELIELAPKDPSGWIGLGVALAVAGEYSDAYERLIKARELAPQLAIVHYDLALVHQRLDQLDAAIAAGKLAVELDPYFMPARNNLAATLIQDGRSDEARKELLAAIAIRPTYAPAHNNLGIVLLGDGDLPGASAELEKAVKAAPRVATFHFNLGVAYFRQQRIDDARAQFSEVLALDAANPDAARNLRWLDGLKAGTIKGTTLPSMSSKYSLDEFDE